ncbi:LOW QUALITY PROTEIN: hypothetical protein CVT25_013904 [Psilocybe cyanescens]|uniref:Uncharacterized protein n=1 Tax=Psilocybe cyanescens TaxID=93625 RepID=A0A409W0Q2_PSICY|nr:LOW QUALITY PROTEIN: hypothetical protein CVT25_013904 [Psilocybe cyanescens]
MYSPNQDCKMKDNTPPLVERRVDQIKGFAVAAPNDDDHLSDDETMVDVICENEMNEWEGMIKESVDGMGGMEERVDTMEGRENVIEEQVDGMEERVDTMREDGMDKSVDGTDDRMDEQEGGVEEQEDGREEWEDGVEEWEDGIDVDE